MAGFHRDVLINVICRCDWGAQNPGGNRTAMFGANTAEAVITFSRELAEAGIIMQPFARAGDPEGPNKLVPVTALDEDIKKLREDPEIMKPVKTGPYGRTAGNSHDGTGRY